MLSGTLSVFPGRNMSVSHVTTVVSSLQLTLTPSALHSGTYKILKNRAPIVEPGVVLTKCNYPGKNMENFPGT